MMTLRCPNCGSLSQYGIRGFLGKFANCPRCGSAFVPSGFWIAPSRAAPARRETTTLDLILLLDLGRTAARQREQPVLQYEQAC